MVTRLTLALILSLFGMGCGHAQQVHDVNIPVAIYSPPPAELFQPISNACQNVKIIVDKMTSDCLKQILFEQHTRIKAWEAWSNAHKGDPQ